MRPDQRDLLVTARRTVGGQVAQPECQMLPAVDETVEAEHPCLRDIAVGETQRHGDLRADRRGGHLHQHRPVPQSSSNRDERA